MKDFSNDRGFNGFKIRQYKRTITLKMYTDQSNFEIDAMDKFYQSFEEDLYENDMSLVYSSYDGYWYVYNNENQWFSFGHYYSMSTEIDDTIETLLKGELVRLYRIEKEAEKELNDYHIHR